MAADKIEEAWKSYSERVLNKEASAIQIHETKLAFFAGAVALWSTIMGEEMSKLSEKESEAILDDIHLEIGQFIKSLGKSIMIKSMLINSKTTSIN
jgi:hypothetical protein